MSKSYNRGIENGKINEKRKMSNEVVCEQCGIEYHRNGRIYNNLCSYCYLYGDDCNKCDIKEYCKKRK